MGKPGRSQGPLKGRTEEANALASFLRVLTADSTVSDLEERYKLARSSWSEYRSGQRIIPWERLRQIVESRHAHDPRARQKVMEQARRFHAAAEAAQPPAQAAVPAPTPAVSVPAPVGTGTGQPADNPATSEDVPQSVGESSERTPSGHLGQAPPVPVRPGAVQAPGPGSSGTWSAPVPDTRPEQAAAAGTPVPASGAGSTGARGSWWSRWRTPTQWAALAVLLSAVVIANQAQRPGREGQADTAPAATAPGEGIALPASTPPPDTSPSPAASSPVPMPASAAAPAAAQSPPATTAWWAGGSTVAATGKHLYRIGPDHSSVDEYTGSNGIWTKVRDKPTGQIYTSRTTLYATDAATGDVEQFDPATRTWVVIGGPGSSFAATGDRLYGVSPNHSGVFEYTGKVGRWDRVRGATDRVYTSGSTLYATDDVTGNIQQFDRSRGAWTDIGNPGSGFAATDDHLYGIGPEDGVVREYTGLEPKPMTWTKIRDTRTARIYTSRTTLYATDYVTGDIEQYDRTRGTWTKIGSPGVGWVATDDHLYGVSPNHAAIFEYSGTPGANWKQISGQVAS
ncbi:hypothetical protein ACFWOG_20490 [Kitasatospora sp. NPDC058406]|uniref:hypothetical protein n=1 Tax=Kitasatospora sp. NPDC058406 TaxID=3346483 RepID=UPI00365E3CA3